MILWNKMTFLYDINMDEIVLRLLLREKGTEQRKMRTMTTF